MQHPLFQCKENHAPEVGDEQLCVCLSAWPPRDQELKVKPLVLGPEDVTDVYYHAPCNDGFAAAMVAYLFNPNITFHPVSHAQLQALDGTLLRGRKVLFVDICPKPDQLARWNLGTSYIVLDHHVTSASDSQNIPENQKRILMNLSGVGLAWDFFFPHLSMPYLFQAVQAQDIWKLDSVLNAREFMLGLTTRHSHCFLCWWLVIDPPSVQELVKLGRALLQQHNARVQAAVKRADTHGHVKLVNIADYQLINDAGAALCDVDPATVACMWKYEAGVIKASLRSRNPDGVNVALLAKKLGGGGHVHAAGFALHTDCVSHLVQSLHGALSNFHH